ncbi:uncharacterized protein N0V89_005602 [Didymosphaeria variabile]|uniref:BTB domain-containing protein n=1 Tax=Didymosphaeria variabile TaxID=1932322 RepID=A0A9W9CBD0_9PLEO|nr:uncharacterized protein N0V89_005602 [Didymosphaeria variabile]KAJ4353872.1 hypothetical protein N0V89_005602 [Didymosphaeria variabile]
MTKRQASPLSTEACKRRPATSVSKASTTSSSSPSLKESERSASSTSKPAASSHSGPSSSSSELSTPSTTQESVSPKTISKPPTPKTALPGLTHLNVYKQSRVTSDRSHSAVATDIGLPSSQTCTPSHDGTVVGAMPISCRHRLTEQILPSPLSTGTLVRYQPPDNFPVFKSGDVIITYDLGASSREFQLHSSVLCRHSPFFANALQDASPDDTKASWYSFAIEVINGKGRLIRQQSNGDRPNVPQPSPQIIDGVEIKSEDLSDDGNSPGPKPSYTNVVAITHNPRHLAAIACYTQILGSFYNIPPKISTIDISIALAQSEGLIKVATELGCVHVLRAHLSSMYASYRQKVYLAVKSDPPRWIQLAIALENRAIYDECLIHMVGAHPKWPWPTSRKFVAEPVQHLVKQKALELDRLRLEVEHELLLITIHIGDPLRRHIRAPNPAETAEVETWLTVQVFRDELAQHISNVTEHPERTLHLGRLYRGIHKGNLKWLSTEYARELIEGMMTMGWKDLGEDMGKLKEYAARVVEKLADNQLMIDPDAHSVGYLTCVKVRDDDVLWEAGDV